MSGDYEPWNNEPSVNQAPKLEKTPYTDDPKRQKHASWVVWIGDIIILLAAGGFVWYMLHHK